VQEYPFVSVLREPIELFDKVANLGQSDLFEQINVYQDKLEDMNEDHVSKIRQFMNSNGQVAVFDTIRQFYMQDNANLKYISNDSDVELLNGFIHHAKPYTSGLAQKANEAYLRVQSNLNSILEIERAEVVKKADHFIDLFQSNNDFNIYLNPDQKLQVQKPFLDAKNSVSRVRIIDSLKNTLNSMSSTYTEQNDLSEDMIYQSKIAKGEIEVLKPKPTVSVATLQRRFSGKFLESEADVDAYVHELKAELMKTIHDDKKISL
jgi:hypothetical protein